MVEAALPPALGPKDVRGRTICKLISPGTELAGFYEGQRFPGYPGYAAVFTAEEVGKEVTGIKADTTLFCMGPHRSFQQDDAAVVLPVPKGLSPQNAVLARLVGGSMTTLTTTAARPGDRVMVTGAGPVGYLAAQIFRLAGYEVHVAEPDDTRRRYIERSGISAVYAKPPCDDATLAGTIALTVECSGHEQAVMDACRMVRKGGEVVLVGVPWRKNTDVFVHELLWFVFHKYVVLRSGWEWELPNRVSDFRPHSIVWGWATALKWLAEGRIPVDGLSTLIAPQEAQSACQDLLHRRAPGLFSIFDWEGVAGSR